MREGHLEKKCRKLAIDKGYNVRKITFIGEKGCPDRLFYKPGHLFFVEFKSDIGVLAKMQVYQIRLLKEANQEVYVIDNIEDFLRILK